MAETISNIQKTTRYIRQEDALKICEMKTQDILYITDIFGKRCDCVVGTINANEIAEQIKKIPFADVRPVVHGKWKYGVCQTCFFDWSDVAPFANVPNFCPNCGTDMRDKVV